MAHKVVEVNAVDACLGAAEAATKDGKLAVVLCTGDDDESGSSWCPDCVAAKPVVDKVLKEHGGDHVVLVVCKVGDRTTWKDPNNAFRTHDKFRLKSIPTLFAWGTPKRLVEAECSDEGKVELLFED
ncbi:thioredoxin domain-containing protein 17 [Salpingoeca rosetta]|uniref:Thioredoxin domain-containing protein 17 n=1 Tax=Salpingoeca rosetta (strain ATCC 50818 / BSB-021) TaxID=946362 RepID=F2UFV1_SALR5|nr:thioredoxin domain-containing protein 17 [Salpingoeca rosetta]EGD75379.1 thioredoxin domain-containing protein 17 [Salpingoeca rosetta]|eukprot:XP_004991836.1 thioredoxin domain-containing protein 17 [Salpingoeca rosetta]